jgi:serine/threonine-protein kinase RsbW
MIESPNVRLALPSRPENVVLVRDVLAGLAEGLDLGMIVEDIKAAVSEAANNAVLYAYGGAEGPLEVEIAVEGRQLDVVVRDHGVGIGPRVVDDSRPGRGIGLMVIQALTASCELRAPDGGTGVEVAMRFDVPPQPRFPGLSGGDDRSRPAIDLADAIEIAIAPARLSAAIFDRLVMGLAARASFSIDRLSDLQLVIDALTARIGHALVSDYVQLAAAVRARDVELRVSPLRAGGAATLVSDSAIGDLGPVIGRLADEVVTGRDEAAPNGQEMLVLILRDRRPGESPLAAADPS